MERITVSLGERSYPISIGAGLLGNPALFSNLFPSSKDLSLQQVVIITNTTVGPLYADKVKHQFVELGCQTQVLELPDGEKYKSLDTFNDVMSFLLENNYSRDVLLVALGGGVIGDLVGFVAASYQRGVDFVQIPTTLLSQVDSSVGGKTAVNHPLGKNMIGAFYQPKSVIIDINTLATLPDREFAAGMAEVVKYGIIIDRPFFEWIEQHIDSLTELESTAITKAIANCCQIKADVVAQDEKESGVRALLNLGHTFGHAIEAELGYGKWLHGEAVSSGTVMAARAAAHAGMLDAIDVERIESLLVACDLPVHTPDSMSGEDFMKHMMRDKKVLSGRLRLILPDSIGSSKVVSDINLTHVYQAIEDGRK
ncbi:3-dehydroquinate synthase [Vibrio sp. UCD-FRSSP16_10]|uniref:3-dehydroquinate synthase n=1 Tax=unclassified Vibrio TaxID=2614977 RepID=UPI0007FE66D1|nr:MULTISPECIES: 3-dehydroquinate synthase [unclassified Vibrio]OBT10069.1 3-dehydroquinate synthase [Vibrio sp. UCD-FRSSP16_30]OBT18859.1 3-dehydroquinate synthase [Vibrio sp. UCD-FRSSP16_10]